MNQSGASYGELIERSVKWAESRSDIRAAVIMGSRARVDHPADEWADPRVVEGLRDAFAHYDRKDVRRALLKVMCLFRWIAVETAEKLGYQYPSKPDERISRWVSDCLSAEAN